MVLSLKLYSTHALISMIHHWLQMTDGKAVAVRAVFLDFKKAFDMIDHNLFIIFLTLSSSKGQ